MNGVQFERQTTTLIAQEEKIRPLGDRIIVKPLDWEASKIVIAIREGRPVRGRVLAVGPGAHRKKYSKDRSSYQLGEFIPMTVKVGDIVNWGGLNVFDGRGYSFDEIIWGTERCLVITEKDVAFIEQA